MKKAVFAFLAIAIIAGLIILINKNQATYIKIQGFAHGTTYHIIYKHPRGINLKAGLEKVMDSVDASLSTYDSTSIISRINRNENVKPDADFKKVFRRAQEISNATNGAFDITIAPVVNAWGFGFTERTKVDSSIIDSLQQFTGFAKVALQNEIIKKQDSSIMLDVNAIAKGFSVDKTARYLEGKTINNYMVEIGGEVRVKGKNSSGEAWRIGIDRPIEDPEARKRELKTVVSLKNGALATSGNYRRFYVEDGTKYSHTINPKTGFPVRHNLLSASVYANDCMTADAYATAFMVMGLEKSQSMVRQNPELEAYFIYADENGDEQVIATDAFKQKIK